MWKLSQYLMDSLKSRGFIVGCTKSSINDYPKTDGKDDVYKRGAMAKGYDLMLSLHSNACGTESVNRAVLVYPMSGAKKDLAEKLGACVKSTMGLTGYQLCQRRLDTYAYVYTGMKSTTIKDYYGVIRGSVAQGTPAIIIEHGFHTNAAVAKWLCSDTNLKKLAEAEAKCIADYYGTTAGSSTGSSTTAKKVYRVQVGAYSQIANANAMAAKLKAAGFSALITKSGTLYRVQVGAYSVKSNAEAMQNKLKSAGFPGVIV